MKIFVSYSRKDAGELAEQIQRRFSSDQYVVFTDVNNIRVGDVWTNAIDDNISKCDIFVAIVTHGALQSPHVEKEVLQAQREKKRIIPCLHRSVLHSNIKWGLDKIQGVEFEDKFELARNLYAKIANDQPARPMTNNPREVDKMLAEPAPRSRPTGVTIIAILNIIGGIIMLFGGLTLLAAGIILPSLPQSAFEDGSLSINGNLTGSGMSASGIPPSFLGGVAIAIGGVIIAIGIVSFIVAYGLFKGRSWAWIVTIILSIISIILNVISIATGNLGGIVSIIISGIILYYLYRPHVKAYFGKTVSTSGTSSVAQV